MVEGAEEDILSVGLIGCGRRKEGWERRAYDLLHLPQVCSNLGWWHGADGDSGRGKADPPIVCSSLHWCKYFTAGGISTGLATSAVFVSKILA